MTIGITSFQVVINELCEYETRVSGFVFFFKREFLVLVVNFPPICAEAFLLVAFLEVYVHVLLWAHPPLSLARSPVWVPAFQSGN